METASFTNNLTIFYKRSALGTFFSDDGFACHSADPLFTNILKRFAIRLFVFIIGCGRDTPSAFV